MPNNGKNNKNDKDNAIHAIFGRYIDRLNAGETLDADAIRQEHPDCAEELIEQLTEFQAFGQGDSDKTDKVADAFRQYKIRGELGRGGMGIVYDAEDISMGRRVALKVLSAGLVVDERSVERFRREARIVAKLKHPNIVQVYATGVEEKTPFTAMEFVDGESLEKILERKRPQRKTTTNWKTRLLSAVTVRVGAPSPEGTAPEKSAPKAGDSSSPIPNATTDMDLSYCIRMARTFAAVAEGLEHAHANGITHRDLKPSNLILDSDGNLRILDFGLARLEGQKHLTGSREILGTPRYMSPEQARGSSKVTVDARTDIYSLGTTLYEVLTLTAPFEGRTAADTLSRIIHAEPRSPRHFNPRIPRDLETIVLRCLRKNPADRDSSAGALADDLRRFSRGDPIQARPRSLSEITRTWLRQHWRQIAAAAAVVLVALLAVRSQYESRQRRWVEYEDLVGEAAVKIQRSAALTETAGIFAWEGSGFNPFLLTGDLDEEYSPDDHIREAMALLERAIASVPERPAAHFHLARALVSQEDSDRAIVAVDQAIERGSVAAGVLKATWLEWEGRTEEAEALLTETRHRAQSAWVDLWLTASERQASTESPLAQETRHRRVGGWRQDGSFEAPR